MKDSLRVSYRELAEWLDLPAETVRQKVRHRAAQGQWKIIPAQGATGSDLVELPAADLNGELDARHDGPACPDLHEEPRQVPAARGTTRDEPHPAAREHVAESPKAASARDRSREDELGRLLIEARDAVEQAQERLLAADRERAELAEAQARAAALTEQVIEGKTALIAAYDKVLAMQQELATARQDATTAQHEAAEAESILSILDRLRNRPAK